MHYFFEKKTVKSPPLATGGWGSAPDFVFVTPLYCYNLL